MTYVCIETFADLQDNAHIYKPGDPFPRLGVEVSDERLKELSSGANRLNRPLIQAVKPKRRKAKD